ncbi:PAS domain S-box-containing protein [Flavobacterium fryxellicola]|uniref:Histidine kinase n=1 Tax=Flavobacterium fryxellicola TaxID=249352 RepID=A0A168ADK5_9FLAO|nr:PAS domain-containing protein [Flavobacterium fryxellicola]OAB31369.1 histidine kinase [Flavobacterium fryxellicola]SHN54432.1 PAS domain S-box-containing protein [Flavobacterium fryxellicola]
MSDFRQYEEAIAMYHSNLTIKTVPVYSWDFHSDFLSAIKNFFADLSKLNAIAVQNKWAQNNWDLKKSLKEEVIVVTDVKLQIVFASHNMMTMNGYSAAEVLGKSPKMFQGEATNQITSNEIRKAILHQQPFEKTVMNYKKNGEVYVCLIKGFPVFNSKGELRHYIAFEKAA